MFCASKIDTILGANPNILLKKCKVIYQISATKQEGKGGWDIIG